MPAWPRKRAEIELKRLATKHRVRVRWIKAGWMSFSTTYGERAIYVSKPWTPLHYLSALHELGHLLSRRAKATWDADDADGVLACEGAAWGWAIAHADPELLACMTGAQWAKVGFMMTTYARAFAGS